MSSIWIVASLSIIDGSIKCRDILDVYSEKLKAEECVKLLTGQFFDATLRDLLHLLPEHYYNLTMVEQLVDAKTSVVWFVMFLNLSQFIEMDLYDTRFTVHTSKEEALQRVEYYKWALQTCFGHKYWNIEDEGVWCMEDMYRLMMVERDVK